MGLEIVPYTADRIAAVRSFNARLAAGGLHEEHEQFPETPDPGWMPGLELFVAVEDDAVRGGYMLRRQKFWSRDEMVDAAHYRLPLSEGFIDRKYAMLGLLMLRDALARSPRLYAMGMAGRDKPLPQMLKRLKWQIDEIPFYFKVVRPGPFLRQIRALRTSTIRRVALDVAALSGAGWVGMKALGISRRLPAERVELTGAFGAWADEVWKGARGAYGVMAARDAATLDELYPASDPRFLRVRTREGWAVALDTQMSGHRQFGDMRVGTIVDGLAPPAGVAPLVRAATSLLEQRGVDLIVSNQESGAWGGAMRAAGFRGGPSNYLVALSPAFGEVAAEQCHFNRGDGDGPIHL